MSAPPGRNASGTAGDLCFGCMKRCPYRQVPAGDEAKVPGKTLLFQALSACVPPLLGFAAGFFTLGLVFPQSGEPARAAAGVLGLFAAALLLYRLRGRPPRRRSPGQP